MLSLTLRCRLTSNFRVRNYDIRPICYNVIKRCKKAIRSYAVMTTDMTFCALHQCDFDPMTS